MSSRLLASALASAFRFLLGVDGGGEYDTTALSVPHPQTLEVAERDPWALRVRPDLTLAVFDDRYLFYVLGSGTFVQPLLASFETSGELFTGVRIRYERGALHPGAFVRAGSSNELIRLQQRAGVTVPTTELFYVVSAGGFLEGEVGLTPVTRLVANLELEAWVGDIVPQEMRGLLPTAAVTADAGVLYALTPVDGLGGQVELIEGIYGGQVVEHQLTLTTRAIHRRLWTPHVTTDASVGVVALRERHGSWRPELSVRALVLYAGRPRWFALSAGYERSFESFTLRSTGSMMDVAEATTAFGPFSRFSFSVGLRWTRADQEVRSRQTGEFAPRPFHTFGGVFDARYLYETGGLGVGPFVEGYVFTPIAEQAPYDRGYEYLPPGYDEVEVVVYAGLRFQWGLGNGEGGGVDRHQGDVLASGRAGTARGLGLSTLARRAGLAEAARRREREGELSTLDRIFGSSNPLDRLETGFEREVFGSTAAPDPALEGIDDEDRRALEEERRSADDPEGPEGPAEPESEHEGGGGGLSVRGGMLTYEIEVPGDNEGETTTAPDGEGGEGDDPPPPE